LDCPRSAATLDLDRGLLGIDALMDMGRTCVNVVGNYVATVVVAVWEGDPRRRADLRAARDARFRAGAPWVSMSPSQGVDLDDGIRDRRSHPGSLAGSPVALA
jgi:hypothetical protein